MFRFLLGLTTAFLMPPCFGAHAEHAVAIKNFIDIESKYLLDGPFRPSLAHSGAACDRKGNLCDIWFPSDAQDEQVLPVVLWANGTADVPVEPAIYDYLLSHFASWGFIVIATRDPKTGYGDTVLDTLSYLRRIANEPSHTLYHRVDFDRVGVAGHSQGATGAINAMLKSDRQIRTTVAFQLPQQRWCSPSDLCVLTDDLKNASHGSIFYVGGTYDFIISPDRQWIGSDLNSLTAYYNATPDHMLKVKALVSQANHNDILGKPDCKSAAIGSPLTCTHGVKGYLGLPTAWLAWQLQGSEEAKNAFRNKSGELFSAHGWSGQLSNVP